MARKPGTKTDGTGFPDSTIHRVWEKGSPIPNSNPAAVRKDKYGAAIRGHAQGTTGSLGTSHPSSVRFLITEVSQDRGRPIDCPLLASEGFE
jgi:hypothetical protein